MSDAKTGLWSAFGALAGGALGAAAGHFAAKHRPRVRYSMHSRGQEIEDAMVVGGAMGAVFGAFIGGAAGAEDPAPSPRLPPR